MVGTVVNVPKFFILLYAYLVQWLSKKNTENNIGKSWSFKVFTEDKLERWQLLNSLQKKHGLQKKKTSASSHTLILNTDGKLLPFQQGI